MLHAIAAFLRREGETLERAPAHEMLRVGLCLAFTGGFLDAYTYLLRGGVFANAQTGNMVLMALYAARRAVRRFGTVRSSSCSVQEPGRARCWPAPGAYTPCGRAAPRCWRLSG